MLNINLASFIVKQSGKSMDHQEAEMILTKQSSTLSLKPTVVEDQKKEQKKVDKKGGKSKKDTHQESVRY